MKRGMEPFLVLNRTISSKSAPSLPPKNGKPFIDAMMESEWYYFLALYIELIDSE